MVQTKSLGWTALLVFLSLVAVGLMTGTAAAQSAPDCGNVSYAQDGGGNYQVTNVSQLQCMGNASTSTSLSDSFVLTGDIDASNTSSWNSGAGFDPVGDGTTPFTGTFDGNNNSISGLYINRGTEGYVGLFGAVGSDAATVGPRAAEGVQVNGVSSGGNVKDIAVTDADVTGEGVGGPGGPGVGAIVGTNRGNITRSRSSGQVTSTLDLAGGLVGNNHNGNVTESYADVTVEGTTAGIGGLVGTNTGTGVVENTYATGNVTGDTYVGGLVGYNTATIRTSYAVGNVSTDGGGLVGLSDKGTATDSYWDINTTGRTSSAGGTGLTTEEMTGAAAATNMTGFDFATTWDLTESYPRLAWEGVSGPNTVVSCSEIASSGAYVLTQDLNSTGTCIEITGDDITLDGNGYKIEGEGVGIEDGEYGIHVQGANNVTVENVTLTGWGNTAPPSVTTEGEPLTDEQRRAKRNGEVGTLSYDSGSSGVLYENADAGDVADVTATGNYQGVTFDVVTGSNVTDSDVSGNRRGVYMYDSNGNAVTATTANANVVNGIGVSVGSENNEVSNNTARGNSYNGIRLFFASNNELADNDVSSNDRVGAGLTLSDDNDLSGNTFNGNGKEGVRLTDSDGNTFTNNTADSNKIGYSFEGSLEGSNNNNGPNNTANGNRRAGVLSDGQSTNNLGLGTSSFSGIFGTAEDEPVGTEAIGYFEAEGTMTVSVGYDEGEVNEGEINVRGHDGDEWSDVNSTVDEEDDVVVAEVDGSHEVYGVFGGDVGVFSKPLVDGFSSAPANTEELDPTLYEDLDGDGDGTDVSETVTVFGELIRGNDLGLSDEQVSRLDWDGDDELTSSDMVTLFGKQIRRE